MAKKWAFSVILLLSFTLTPVYAQENSHRLKFRPFLYAKHAKVDIETICCGKRGNENFGKPISKLYTHYGQSPFWVKIEGVTGDGLIQFSPILDKVVLYARSKNDPDWQISRTGDTLPNSLKPLATPSMALPLPKNVDPLEIYAHITQPTAVAITAKDWMFAAFIAKQETDRTIKTFLLGFVSAIIFYNIAISWLIRNVAFFFNAACISSLVATSLYLSGYGSAYVWASWYHLSNLIFCLSVWAGVVFGGAFFYTFLKTPDKSVRAYWPLFIAPIVATILAFGVFITQAPYWIFQGSMLVCIALLFISATPFIIWRAIKNQPHAKILLIPIAFAILPGLLFVALNKIAGINLFNFENNAMELTLSFEALLFSLALASRIRLTEAANEQATQKLLKMRERRSAIALSAQDNERRRLARELHDGIGQELLLVVSHLKRMTRNNVPDHLLKPIAQVIQMASGTMNNLRRISQDMHPASLEHLGLVPTIKDLVDHFNQSQTIEFSHTLDLKGYEFSQDAQFHLVRILQECLSNVVKHSGATYCTMSMLKIGDEVEIKILDDGIGIDKNVVSNFSSNGLGLTSIDERVRALGGTWEMTPRAKGGLQTMIIIPINNDTNA